MFRMYASPLGNILLRADESGLTGLWFEGARGAPPVPVAAPVAASAASAPDAASTAVAAACHWLDDYFSGAIPVTQVPLSLQGTPFQLRVWSALRTLPYGTLLPYGELARRLGVRSPRAVGQAVGRNPVSLIVPCHRIVAAHGRLGGYAGGTEIKCRLLALEGHAF